MKTTLVPVTQKSSVPRGVMNALLGPFIRAKTTGYDANKLNFLSDVEHLSSTSIDAPVGYVPRRGVYENIIPPLHELDPTSGLALSTRLFHENDKTSTIGRTSTLREAAYHYAVSGQFAAWWKEYCILAGLAIATQQERNQGRRVRLDENLEIYEGDGFIEAFLLATGDLNDPTLGFNDHDDVDCDAIFTRVVEALKSVIDALNHDGYEAVAKELSNSLGIGLNPVGKGTATLLRAETFEKLFVSNLKLALRHPHARRMLKEVIISRIPANVCGIDKSFSIAVGQDILIIPADLMRDSSTPAALFDRMCVEADNRPDLDTVAYNRTAFAFEHQFYTIGDLVKALFVDETVDVLDESQLSVLLSLPVATTIQGTAGISLSDYIPGTGGLGSINQVRNDRINVIYGMQNHYISMDETIIGGDDEGMRTFDRNLVFSLPNGLLDMTSPANATALNWFEFMQWYRRTRSSDLENVLGRGGTSATKIKKDLKPLPVRLDNALTAFARLNYDSQKDGVTQSCQATFNQNKILRLEHQGPALLDLGHHVGPAIVAGANGWSRSEDSRHLTRTSIDSGVIPMDGTTVTSVMFGEIQGKKTPTPYLPKGLVQEDMLGSNNPELEIAYNVMSMPLSLSGATTLPTFISPSTSMPTRGTVFLGGQDQRAVVSKTAYWNIDPVSGFKRGFVMGRTGVNGFTDSGTSAGSLSDWSRNSVGNSIRLPVDGVDKIVNRPAGVTLGPGVTQTTAEVVATMKSEEFELQPYVGSDNDSALMRKVWFWDPSQTQAVGRTNFALYGEYCNSLCFSAAHATHPTVAVGAITTRDLNGDKPNYMATTGTKLIIAEDMQNDHAVAAAPFAMNSPHTITRDVALLDGRIEQENDTYPAVGVTNLWFDSADVVSDTLAQDHEANIGLEIVGTRVYDGADVTDEIISEMAHISVIRKLLSTTNPYAKCPNQLTGYGLNATDGSYTGAVVFGSDLTPIPNMFNGPSTIPMNGDKTIMAVYGIGACHMDERNSHAFSVLHAVTSRTGDVSEETTPSWYPGAQFAEHIPPFIEERARATPSTGVFTDLPNLAANTGFVTGRTNLPGYSTARNPWFHNSAGYVPSSIPRHLGYLRQHQLYGSMNPWMRPSNSDSGWKVGVYDPSKLSSLISQDIRQKMIDAGSATTGDMTNDDWRNIYVIN